MNRKFALRLLVVVALVFSVAMLIAAAKEIETIGKLQVRVIEPLRAATSGVAVGHYWATFGKNENKTGVSLVGTFDFSGATIWQAAQNTATLAGVTGTVSWSASSSGASGWHLTPTIMHKYSDFLVENSFPYSTLAGATIYSDRCPAGSAKSGNTVYLPDITADLDKKKFTFTNELGTTPFVLYDPNGRFRFAAATGATPFSSLTNLQSGVTTIPDSVGESITIMARYLPTTASGWYVVGKMIEW